MVIRVNMTCVRTPIVRIIVCDAKGLKHRFELQKDLILAMSKDIRQHFAAMVINGMP